MGNRKNIRSKKVKRWLGNEDNISNAFLIFATVVALVATVAIFIN